MNRFWLALATLLGLAVQAVPASAAVTASETYTLNCTTNPCNSSSPSYGTVELIGFNSEKTGSTSNSVQVIVTLASGYKFATGMGNYDLVWNWSSNTNIPDETISNPTTHFSAVNGGHNGSYAVNTFSSTSSGVCIAGCFDYAIQRSDNGSNSISTLTFDVTKNNGLALGDFGTNSGGFSFAALIVSTTGGNNFTVASNLDPVPEPMTWTMSIAGLLGLAGFAVLDQRRKKVSRLG